MLATFRTDDARGVLSKLSVDRLTEAKVMLGTTGAIARSKRGAIDLMAEALRHEFPADVIAGLDVEILQSGAKARKWSLFALDRATSEFDALAIRELRTRLARELCVHYATHVHATLSQGSVWIRIHTEDPSQAEHAEAGRRGKRPRIVYAVHAPRTTGVAVSGMSREVQDCIAHALAVSLGARTCLPTRTVGRTLTGILGLQKHFASQGAHSVYRAQLVDDDPLAPSLERAAGSAAGYAKQAVQGRAVSAMQEAAEAASAAGGVVVSEDAAQHLQGVLDGEDAFGLGEAAPMPHALFETTGPVRFGGEAVDMTCNVSLEGHNVAEGLRALVEAGHAQAPLPDFLLQLPHALGSTLSDRVSAEEAQAAQDPARAQQE